MEKDRRLSQWESYLRRWNPILYGIPERKRKDVRGRVIDVCQHILPEDKDKLPNVIDTVHRLGRKQPNKTRGNILQFACSFYRDAVWRAANESTLIQENKIKLQRTCLLRTKKEEISVGQQWRKLEKITNVPTLLELGLL